MQTTKITQQMPVSAPNVHSHCVVDTTVRIEKENRLYLIPSDMIKYEPETNRIHMCHRMPKFIYQD